MKYIVALQTGGLMEDPEIRYEDVEVIEAESEEKAKTIYNIKHNCEFFYGHVLGEIHDNIAVYLYSDNHNLDLSIFENNLLKYLIPDYYNKKMWLGVIERPSSGEPQINFTGPAKYIIGYSKMDDLSSYPLLNEMKVDISDIDIIEGKNIDEAKQRYRDKYGYHKSRINCIGEIRGSQVYLYKNKITKLKNVKFTAENICDLMISSFDVTICDIPPQ